MHLYYIVMNNPMTSPASHTDTIIIISIIIILFVHKHGITNRKWTYELTKRYWYSMCVCPIELISVSKCSLVRKDGGRYNKPSLLNCSSNKKLARTVPSGNRSEIYRSRKYPLLNWNIRKRSGETSHRNRQVTALRPVGDLIGLIQRPCLTTHSTSIILLKLVK